MPDTTHLMTHLFIQMAVILVACWGLGSLLRRLGQTQVVSDMVAGFLLGPSLLGLALPGVQQWLFPTTLELDGSDGAISIQHPNLTILYAIGQIGLVFYMFLVGTYFDTKLLSGHLRHSFVISATGVCVPLLAGGEVGWFLADNDLFFPEHVGAPQAAIFVGSAVAIAAFPMLARIIEDSGLAKTRLGTVALACAAFDDAIAWILLALVVSLASGSLFAIGLAVGGTIIYMLLMLAPGRWLFRRIERWAAVDQSTIRREVLVLVVAIVLISAAATEGIGVYSVFGAFIAGALMPRGAMTKQLQSWMQPVTTYILLPVFFVYSGLNTHLELLIDPVIAGVLVAIIVIGFLSKGGACYVACRLVRFTRQESASLAALMNARGLMELILLDIGRQAGLVSPALYTVLALMTVVTTLAASPLYAWAQRPSRRLNRQRTV